MINVETLKDIQPVYEIMPKELIDLYKKDIESRQLWRKLTSAMSIMASLCVIGCCVKRMFED